MIHRNLLKKVKRANKDRKLKLAKENGFDSIETFIKHLEDNLEPEVDSPEKPTIHIIYVQDSSGSMFWQTPSKFSVATGGISKELKELKKDTNANYLISAIEFSGKSCIIAQNSTLDTIKIEWNSFKGGTALNDAIITACNLAKTLPKKDKVLIKVFTDGQEQHSNTARSMVNYILDSLLENITFTFVAAKEDFSYIKRYNIDESNILLHDNTSRGVENSFDITTKATMDYSSKVIKGEDVLTGFYKKVGTL